MNCPLCGSPMNLILNMIYTTKVDIDEEGIIEWQNADPVDLDGNIPQNEDGSDWELLCSNWRCRQSFRGDKLKIEGDHIEIQSNISGDGN